MKFLRIFLFFLPIYPTYCCCANQQDTAISAQNFLELLKTDGAGKKVDTILGPPLPLNFLFHLKNLRESTKSVVISSELLLWASGSQKPRIFKNNSLNIFFQKLFILIKNNYQDISLSRVNLFHGHLVQTSDDFIVVFHAFEYPLDLEPYKFKKAKKLNPKIRSFTSSFEGFNRRNLIWSLEKNKIWRFDTSINSNFNFLVKSQAFDLYPDEVLRANSLQEQFFGKNIADINYFPEEEKRIFINLK